MNLPKVTLKNGLVIANFSSNHKKFNPDSNTAFTFRDGSELPNCSMERMNVLSLNMIDEKEDNVLYYKVYKGFELTQEIRNELIRIVNDEKVQLIIVPFPMLQCIVNDDVVRAYPAILRKCCTVSIDRATGICSTTEFCFLK